MQNIQEELKTAQHRYFLEMENHAKLLKEISLLDDRVDDATRQINLIDARIKSLTEQRSVLHADIVAGNQPINAADKIGDQLAQARRQAADYDEILLLTRQTLESKRRDQLESKLGNKKSAVYAAAAKLMLAELTPALQKAVAIYSAGLPYYVTDRHQHIKDFVTDACFTHEENTRPFLLEAEQLYLTPEGAQQCS
ncbi:hypothetical protein SAMN02745119_00219 [Trichlorobacter thiogenes]|uniref:Uncharacterized protein n=1 Tax=Trichlorobacter thiogenes TaxID=115783 RepID=A0A1T4K0D5_9BACT|nr:hypothetical protein [Trichlorobacter thiogenes]SJZ35745.1 hypothetical protein SAMN02745119_00219 [Trichlorobacter thiogenes]